MRPESHIAPTWVSGTHWCFHHCPKPRTHVPHHQQVRSAARLCKSLPSQDSSMPALTRSAVSPLPQLPTFSCLIIKYKQTQPFLLPPASFPSSVASSSLCSSHTDFAGFLTHTGHGPASGPLHVLFLSQECCLPRYLPGSLLSSLRSPSQRGLP
jgi:hypothetical protein